MIINPYFTSEKYRGRGYAKLLLGYMLSDSSVYWENMYAVVESNNLPSIRALESVGMSFLGICEKKHWSFFLFEGQTEGRLRVYRYTRKSTVL